MQVSLDGHDPAPRSGLENSADLLSLFLLQCLLPSLALVSLFLQAHFQFRMSAATSPLTVNPTPTTALQQAAQRNNADFDKDTMDSSRPAPPPAYSAVSRVTRGRSLRPIVLLCTAGSFIWCATSLNSPFLLIRHPLVQVYLHLCSLLSSHIRRWQLWQASRKLHHTRCLLRCVGPSRGRRVLGGMETADQSGKAVHLASHSGSCAGRGRRDYPSGTPLCLQAGYTQRMRSSGAQ